MKNKSLFSIEILAYILKFAFAIFALFLLYFAIQDFVDLTDVLFAKHSELYNYGQLKGDTKHQFLNFLYDHQYSIYGGNSNKINDGVPFKKSIILYHLFGFLPNFMLFIICCIAVVFFHNVCEKKLFDKNNAKKLLLISLLLVLIPIIEVIGDQIILAATTNAINSKINNSANYLSPKIKFIGFNYAYLLTAIFVYSQYLILHYGNDKIEYTIKQHELNIKK